VRTTDPAPAPAPPPDPRSDDAAGAALDEAVGLAFRVLKGVMAVLVVLFVASGAFTVEESEVAFVRRAGRLGGEPLRPGGHLAWPVLDDVVRVDMRTRREVVETFDLTRTEAEIMEGRVGSREGGLDPRVDGALVTGDGALVHVALAASYRVTDPYAYLVSARADVADPPADLEPIAADPELVAVLLERAATLTAARGGTDAVLGVGKGAFGDRTRRTVQASLDALGAGLGVERVELERDLMPPPQVREAFDWVNEAAQQRDQRRSGAQRRAAEVASDGRIEAARRRARAAAKAESIEAEAEADAAVFAALLAERAGGRRALQERLLATTLAEALRGVDEAFLVREGGLRVRLERDVRARTRELEEEAYREALPSAGGD